MNEICVGVDTPDGQIVDLATDEHAMALEDALVQAALVGRRRETVTSDDRVHELFPECAGFRMALEGMLDREHHVTRGSDTVTSKVPIGVLVVDDHKGRFIWWRRIRICVCRVHFQTDVTLVGTQSKEETHARLFDAA